MQQRHCRTFFNARNDKLANVMSQFVATKIALDDQPGIECFMQDGAPPHRTENVCSFFHEYLENKIIVLDYSKFTGTEIDWPPYSSDLTPCNYYSLWGTLKDCLPKHSYHAGCALIADLCGMLIHSC
ncbi:DDE_3 domain-containing protein [Nephila pilipes]|uniref:DDE_3 domain-containing protein n=1 Tax=Nephila pilipes TaxID=299642 RepID=A0A8X6M746_NEPPI|nr:DDE_3 domain-containing protein [Nephila pilipes]